MPTLLVTRRMSPELAARVQAAVSGRRLSSSRPRSLKGALRLLTLTFLVTALVGGFYLRQQQVEKLEAERVRLLEVLEKAGRGLTRADRELPARVLSIIAFHTTPSYAGDYVAPELRSETRFRDALSVPTLYLRGSRDALARPERVSEIASASSKDAFVLCWLSPPETRSEQALRQKASAALARGKSMQVAAEVERLAPLLQTLPLLGTEWITRVRLAQTSEALRTLRKLVEAAPLAAAVRAAKARQLLLVLDETDTATGPTELDGERAHPARVVLADLTHGEVRLRFRQTLDPSWLSDQARAQYASGIDSCALALDVRHWATGP